jgi:ADP-ribose pyrophosphatase
VETVPTPRAACLAFRGEHSHPESRARYATRPLMELPALPKHTIVVLDERLSRDPPGFLRLRQRVLKIRFEDGRESGPFEYDAVERERLDAVVMAAHYRDASGKRWVYLRSSLRPPAALRSREASPMAEPATLGNLWELPAGLVEIDEQSPLGLRRAAARELLEEVGVAVDPADLRSLGPSSFPAPAVIGERHFFFHVEVDPRAITVPTEDGSPLEEGAVVVAVPLDEAIALCRRGVIEDTKTELALRRLAEV